MFDLFFFLLFLLKNEVSIYDKKGAKNIIHNRYNKIDKKSQFLRQSQFYCIFNKVGDLNVNRITTLFNSFVREFKRIIYSRVITFCFVRKFTL